jgi:hypothetical protein
LLLYVLAVMGHNSKITLRLTLPRIILEIHNLTYKTVNRKEHRRVVRDLLLLFYLRKPAEGQERRVGHNVSGCYALLERLWGVC